MEVWQSIILGITQGLTEFLPISSSGHLVIVQALLKIPEQIIIPFDIVVHLGTLIAVLAYFWEDLTKLVKGVLAWEKQSLWLAFYIVLGTVPAVIFGFMARDYFEELFGDAKATAWQLILNGFILLVADRLSGERKIDQLKSGDALWIGVGQAIAIIPGISRSGSTIAMGLLRKLSRQAAARFSFLLSIPVILGAGLLDINNMFNGGYQQIGPASFWAGFISAAVSGYFVIKYFLTFLQRGTLKFFAYYCLVLGGITVVWFV